MPGHDDVDRYYADLGRRVRDARNQRGITQASLGHRLGYTRSSVANIEAGRQRLQAHVVSRIAAELGIDQSELLPDSREMFGAEDQVASFDFEDSTSKEFVENALFLATSSPAQAS